MAAAVKGYNCTVVMPMKMSREKVDALILLGAKIVRTPTTAAFDDPNGLIRVAHKLHLDDPENSIILDQVNEQPNERFFVLFFHDRLLTIVGNLVSKQIQSIGTF